MPVARRPNVSAAVLLATLCASPQGHASPAATSEPVAAGDGGVAESVRAADETSTETGKTGTDATAAAPTAADPGVNDPAPPDPGTGGDVERHKELQMYAVPPPPRHRRFGDKRLRQDRGMLAAGIVFAAVCGAGAGIGIWALVEQRNRYYGQDSRDAVGAVTGLLSCTVGALALAATGAARLKKRRGR